MPLRIGNATLSNPFLTGAGLGLLGSLGQGFSGGFNPFAYALEQGMLFDERETERQRFEEERRREIARQEAQDRMAREQFEMQRQLHELALADDDTRRAEQEQARAAMQRLGISIERQDLPGDLSGPPTQRNSMMADLAALGMLPNMIGHLLGQSPEELEALERQRLEADRQFELLQSQEQRLRDRFEWEKSQPPVANWRGELTPAKLAEMKNDFFSEWHKAARQDPVNPYDFKREEAAATTAWNQRMREDRQQGAGGDPGARLVDDVIADANDHLARNVAPEDVAAALKVAAKDIEAQGYDASRIKKLIAALTPSGDSGGGLNFPSSAEIPGPLRVTAAERYRQPGAWELFRQRGGSRFFGDPGRF